MTTTIFNELFDLSREMNRIFDQAGFHKTAWPHTNIYENQEEYIMVAKVPGLNKKDLQITVKDNSLTISGERKKTPPKDAKLLLEERSSGKFERNYLLNDKVDVEGIQAQTANGLLIIKIPKSPEVKPRQITIK
jgi:HSP20 family protein